MAGVSITRSVLRDDARVATIRALLRAAHPVPAAAVTALVGGATLARGAGPVDVLLATVSTAASQLSVGWSNDYLDLAEDRASVRSGKPLVAGEVRPRTVWVGAWAAAVTSLGFATPLGIPAAAAMLVALAAGWAYNLGLKRTPLSWLPYGTAFGLAPVFVWLSADQGLPPGWVPAVSAALGVSGHLTNVLPDLEVDRAVRARGLPHLLGPMRSLVLTGVLLAGTLVLVLIAGGPIDPPGVGVASAGGLLIAAVIVAGVRDRTRLAFLLTIASAAAVVATFLLSFRG